MKGIGYNQKKILKVISQAENNSVKDIYSSCKTTLYPLPSMPTKRQLSQRCQAIHQSIKGLEHKRVLLRLQDKFYITRKISKYLPEYLCTINA